MKEFQQLLTLADDLTLSYISTAEGVRRYLSARREVLALREALITGAITFEDLEEFVRDLVAHFVRGTRSPIDVVLAAIAVAVEPLPLVSFKDFLEDLSRTKIAEMPMAPRVARLSLYWRSNRFAQSTDRDLTIANLTTPPWPPREDRPVRIDVGVDYQSLVLQEA
jgi:hypothetical protein